MTSSSPLLKANTTFTLALLRKLSDDNKTANIFFSPFSISSSLAMVMLGARGNTAIQMSECLKTQDCRDGVHTGFAKLLSVLNKHEGTHEMQLSILPTLPYWLMACLRRQDRQDDAKLSEVNRSDTAHALSIASRLYGEQSFQFVEDFLKQTRTHYNAELEPVDFITHCRNTRVKINSWVEKQTQGKIKDVVAEGDLDPLTRLVLVSAIYFKGTWDERFDRVWTREADFRLNKKETKKVQLMEKRASFPFVFIDEANSKILEMPYKGKELSMLIFLPEDIEDDTTGLEKLEKQLTYEKFVEWTHPDNMKICEVDVKLPRFKLEETYDLNNVLSSMGMVDAFDVTKSDFSGMSGTKELFLSKVTHKAFVEVDEEGTKAAAFCQSFLYLCAVPCFIANHPFLFFIRHNPTMSILFAGRVCSPE